MIYRRQQLDDVVPRADDRTRSVRRGGGVMFDLAWQVRARGKFWTMRRRQKARPTYTVLLFPWKDGKREVRMMRTKRVGDSIGWMEREIDAAPPVWWDSPVFKDVLVRDSHLTTRGDVVVADADLRRMDMTDFVVFEEMVRAIPDFPMLADDRVPPGVAAW